jgi:hypothetical protein
MLFLLGEFLSQPRVDELPAANIRGGVGDEQQEEDSCEDHQHPEQVALVVLGERDAERRDLSRDEVENGNDDRPDREQVERAPFATRLLVQKVVAVFFNPGAQVGRPAISSCSAMPSTYESTQTAERCVQVSAHPYQARSHPRSGPDASATPRAAGCL